MNRIVSFLLAMSFAVSVLGQSREEQDNRAIFNRIEFFMNVRMTDSIYALASEKFRSAISRPQLEFGLSSLYRLGRIKNVELLDFRENTATYGLEFPNALVEARFALNGSRLFDLLQFQPMNKTAAKAPEEEAPTDTAIDERSPMDIFIDSLAGAHLAETEARSLAIGVFHQNAYKTYNYGETERDGGVHPTDSTLYEIEAITKVLTATVLADLAARDIIDLDDPITRFLPDSLTANPDLQAITFKSLANHTSGLPTVPDSLETDPDFDPKDPYAHYGTAALNAYLKNYKATKETSANYAYSNLGYALLGELIARIAEKPFMECLRETVLEPLGMDHTTDAPDPETLQMMCVYDENGEETTIWAFQSFLAAGGLKSTVRDLMLFAVEQFKMPLNDLQNAMALTRQFTFLTADYVDIGLAWHMRLGTEGIYLWHAGRTGGSSAFIGLSPDTRTAVAILSNSAASVDRPGGLLLEKLMGDAGQE